MPLGGFHLSQNFQRAIFNIIRGAGAEKIIAAAELTSEGKENKIFGDRSDYYQSLHITRMLKEVMQRLFWESFKGWISTDSTEKWKSPILDILICMISKDKDSRDT